MTVVPLLSEQSVEGRRGFMPATLDVPRQPLERWIPRERLRREPAALPELSELDVVRHFTQLAQRNYCVDTQFYPLGSCTMKYNPKLCDTLAGQPGFARLHPYQPEQTTQGMLRLLHEMEEWLCEMCGMDAFTLQPAAGAQAELTAMLIARAYHADQGYQRKTVIIPDSAHGTNPASAALCGYNVVEIKSTAAGRVDLAALERALNQDVAVFMLTNPNTLGLFETDIERIVAMVHKVGALLYLDGANLNALLGVSRPGDMGFDLMHVNLHKTFAVPHGGGGPGAGPLGVKRHLAPYLPVPRIARQDDRYQLVHNVPQSIGKVRAFHGNVGAIIRSYVYIRLHGREGIPKISEHAILNANYLRARLRDRYHVPYDEPCMHELVASAVRQKAFGVRALDIAKRLLDHGFYAPTVYFPMIVEEALMIEPTETESKQTLDRFIDAMLAIDEEARRDPASVRRAPSTTPVGRLDEVTAAREPNLSWRHRTSGADDRGDTTRRSAQMAALLKK